MTRIDRSRQRGFELRAGREVDLTAQVEPSAVRLDDELLTLRSRVLANTLITHVEHSRTLRMSRTQVLWPTRVGSPTECRACITARRAVTLAGGQTAGGNASWLAVRRRRWRGRRPWPQALLRASPARHSCRSCPASRSCPARISPPQRTPSFIRSASAILPCRRSSASLSSWSTRKVGLVRAQAADLQLQVMPPESSRTHSKASGRTRRSFVIAVKARPDARMQSVVRAGSPSTRRPRSWCRAGPLGSLPPAPCSTMS